MSHILTPSHLSPLETPPGPIPSRTSRACQPQHTSPERWRILASAQAAWKLRELFAEGVGQSDPVLSDHLCQA